MNVNAKVALINNIHIKTYANRKDRQPGLFAFYEIWPGNSGFSPNKG